MAKNLEFHVQRADGVGNTVVCDTFRDAANLAVQDAASDGREHVIDVITWSRAAARQWAGDHGVEVYDEDPQASVHQRIVIKAEDQGRIS